MTIGETTHAAREAVMPQSLVDKLLGAAGNGLILVGGQALAFWAMHYEVPIDANLACVSRDIDFLAASPADVAEVQRLAAVLGGQAVIPNRRSLTALVGQAIRHISEDEYFNVDVIHKVLGGRSGLRERALEVDFDGRIVRVMHPVDVIGSRLTNLHKLTEKQNSIGDAQMDIAIAIGQRMTATEPDDRQLRKLIEVLATMAQSNAGRMVARRRGRHVADAIEPIGAMKTRTFRDRRLPQLMQLMSATRRSAIARQLAAFQAD